MYSCLLKGVISDYLLIRNSSKKWPIYLGYSLVFIGLWPCIFTTKLSYNQLFKWGHSNATTACCTAWSSGLSLFCLITELLLSLANHAKVVTESVLFQKISTSHRKRCQNEQEGKDSLKVKYTFKSRQMYRNENRDTLFRKIWRGPVPRSSYTPAILSNLFSSKNWILRVCNAN